MASVGEEARHWGWGWAAMAASAHRPPCQAAHRQSQIERGGPLRIGDHEIPQRRRRGRGQERRATERRSGRLEGTIAAAILFLGLEIEEHLQRRQPTIPIQVRAGGSARPAREPVRPLDFSVDYFRQRQLNPRGDGSVDDFRWR
jgi:hypothetical protein